MRKNCNLTLSLVPPSLPPSLNSGHHSDHCEEEPIDPKPKQMQQLTIFYNGRVSACDVTELQARTIIKLASEEMEDKCRSKTPLMASPSGLSMKKSLQRFLQKRKHRVQATSPYHR